MTKTMIILLALAAVGCGGGSEGDDDDAGSAGGDAAVDSGMTVLDAGAPDSASAVDASMGVFSLTSPVLAEGMRFANEYTCVGGIDVSPELAWTPGPAGTLSYAIVLTDVTFNNFVHWVIWDIPANTIPLSLPRAVPRSANLSSPVGAKQCTSYTSPPTFGYRGPCTPVNDGVHNYRFTVYALDVATLPGVTTNTARTAVRTQVLAHDLASASLNGTFSQP